MEGAASGEGEGGGGGGFVEAAPVGYIEISPEGAHFRAIPDPLGTARALRAGATAATAVVAALAGLRELRRRHDAGAPGPRTRRFARR